MSLKTVIKENFVVPCGLLPLWDKVKSSMNKEVEYTPVYWSRNHQELDIAEPYSTTSMLCNSSFFDMPFFQYWAAKVHENFKDLMQASGQLSGFALDEKIVYHRKLWEFVYIAQALYERGMLKPGKRGLGFGVGTEALVAIFADLGCEILATDLANNEAEETGWTETFQHLGSNIKLLNKYMICPEDVFEKNVRFRNVNMNEIPDDIEGYDFNWSACAFEHLGSIENGLNFVRNCLKTLKPGGIAVHTSEFNIFSDDETIDNEPNLVLFRKKDILRLIEQLESEGHYVWPFDFNSGNGIVDDFVDTPPYSQCDMHLKLKLAKFTSTSFGLIVRKKGQGTL